MLVGQFVNTVDDKGRMLIPSKFRNEIAGDKVIVAPGIDNCLRLYTLESWEVVVKEIMESGSTFQSENRTLIRTMISPASECEIDKSGRILIPSHLREKVAIDKDVLLAGSIEYIELWSPSVYSKVMEGSDEAAFRSSEAIGNYFAEKKKGEV